MCETEYKEYKPRGKNKKLLEIVMEIWQTGQMFHECHGGGVGIIGAIEDYKRYFVKKLS